MASSLQPCIVHALPPAPEFVGREKLLADLHALWVDDFAGIVALVGLGGSGKTAIAAHFLEQIGDSTLPAAPGGLFVWSFYRDPDAGQFLRQAAQYFGGVSAAMARAHGLGLVHLLVEALADGRRQLLVLDGLERIQLAGERNIADLGRLEDPLLKTFLTRAATGIGRCLILVTSRFPLTDLERIEAPAYRAMELGGLEAAAAVRLLKRRGVVGDDDALQSLAAKYGDHPLTLDHLGGLIGQFLDGDPSRVPELPQSPAGDPQAIRLSRLLRQYEERLPRPELELLVQLAMFRRGVNEDHLISLLVCSPAVPMHTARDVVEGALRSFQTTTPDEGEWQRHLAEAAGETIATVLFTAPTAGPETTFRAAALEIIGRAFQQVELALDSEAVEIARLYADSTDESPTDEKPLPPPDRLLLRESLSRFARLYTRPSAPILSGDFLRTLQDFGFADVPERRREADLTPADVFRAIANTTVQLRRLFAKHQMLRDVRRLGRRQQQKWRQAGALAPLDARAFHELVESLIRRHLVLRAAEGTLEVHPAVSDHFRRLTEDDAKNRHHAIREHLLSLAHRPGMRLPEDKATLDLVEEAIYHSMQADRPEEAVMLYEKTLGGHRHLAWKLGEVARGLRILRTLPSGGNRWGLAWYLRSLGEIDEAYRQHNMAYFRADVRLLQGRLPAVALEGDPHRTAVAAFLMGERKQVPSLELGCCVSLPQLYLWQGRAEQAMGAAQVIDLYGEYGWEGDRARIQISLAEAHLRLYRLDDCRNHLDEASAWILHSGSMEHLVVLHLALARRARIAGEYNRCLASIENGLHLASHCDFMLHRTELLCERALCALDERRAADAEEPARTALTLATSADCRFAWGALAAKHLLGYALSQLGDVAAARPMLRETLDDAIRLGHPRADAVGRLLAALPQ